MATNVEILEVVTEHVEETRDIKKILDDHILLQIEQDKKVEKMYDWLFLGNGSSAKSQVERNSEYRRNTNKIVIGLALMVIAQWVAILAT